MYPDRKNNFRHTQVSNSRFDTRAEHENNSVIFNIYTWLRIYLQQVISNQVYIPKFLTSNIINISNNKFYFFLFIN